MAIPRDGPYEEFKTFPERGPADSLCSWLEFDGVPSYVRPNALSSAIETQLGAIAFWLGLKGLLASFELWRCHAAAPGAIAVMSEGSLVVRGMVLAAWMS